jgi:hypothetical protein
MDKKGLAHLMILSAEKLFVWSRHGHIMLCTSSNIKIKLLLLE